MNVGDMEDTTEIMPAQTIIDTIRVHVVDCETCRSYPFVPEHLAKHLGLDDRGAVKQALDQLVRDGVLSKITPPKGRKPGERGGRTCYGVRER